VTGYRLLPSHLGKMIWQHWGISASVSSRTVDALLAGELAGGELAFYVSHDNINGLNAVLAQRSGRASV